MKSPKLASDEPALRISKLERETLHDRAYLEVKKRIIRELLATPSSTAAG